MNKGEILQYFNKHYGDRYIVYSSSIKKLERENYFFIVKDKRKSIL